MACIVEKNNRYLAIIPARAGSKRIPNKNIKSLGGHPLIVWTIKAAKNSNSFVDILVSTDCEEIAKISKMAGALVPWLRPDEISSDTAKSSDVIAHATKWYEKEFGSIEAVMLLQPTSPFRTHKSIRKAIEIYEEQIIQNKKNSVISVAIAETHPAWTFVEKKGHFVPCMGWEILKLRSQELPKAYALNGAIYLITSERAKNGEDIISEDFIPYLMQNIYESIDIDTLEDWNTAVNCLNQGLIDITS